MNVVTLANGARAQVLPSGKYRFISGASNEYLDSIRTPAGTVRGPNKRPSSRMPGKRYLTRKIKEEHGFNRRRVLTDMAREKNKVLDFSKAAHRRLARKEGATLRWDIPNFDHGNRDPGWPHGVRMVHPEPLMRPIRVYPVAPRSPAQRAASAAAGARLAALNRARR
jgi:hypothetical protein